MDSPPRLASLDAMRGFAIASMVLVNNPGDWGHLHAPLAHAKWNGWTFTDTVFPFFLFVSGVAMTLSMRVRTEAGTGSARLLVIAARRVAIIFAVGLTLNFIPAFDPASVRIPGVLQRIAVCALIAAPVVIWGGLRSALAAIAMLFVVYSLPMLLVPVPGPEGVVAAGALEPGRDFGAWVDRMVLGGHLWPVTRTWDPEGIVSTLPAAASLLAGVVAGYALMTSRAMALAGATLLVLGLAMDSVFMPINKNLWTPSYAVFMAGWSLVTLAIFRALLDEAPAGWRDRARAACLPLTIFGMNALFLFAFSGLLARALTVVTVEPGVTLKARLFGPISAMPLSAENASLVFAILFQALMFAVAWIMWKKRWFIRA
ncbi:MAG TPA: heparan-alpha-glucosaminide N-acetyltransferase domain-containing protein [Usitatibacter sp.]|nr:heparan-alpha-glucosaminide N-acetyltransferase domain-containing protein [Usitatibacter sp.]